MIQLGATGIHDSSSYIYLWLWSYIRSERTPLSAQYCQVHDFNTPGIHVYCHETDFILSTSVISVHWSQVKTNSLFSPIPFDSDMTASLTKLTMNSKKCLCSAQNILQYISPSPYLKQCKLHFISCVATYGLPYLHQMQDLFMEIVKLHKPFDTVSYQLDDIELTFNCAYLGTYIVTRLHMYA